MVDSETRVRVDRDTLLKSVLDAGRGRRSDPNLNLVRGNVKVTLDQQGDIDFDTPEIQRRLDRAGALDQARAEGFLAGLFMGTTVAMEQMMFPDINDLYPEVEDVDADELLTELEESLDDLEDTVESL